MPDGLQAFEKLLKIQDDRAVSLLCVYLIRRGPQQRVTMLLDIGISMSLMARLLKQGCDEGLIVRLADGAFDVTAKGRQACCPHDHREPVRSIVTEELLAYLCTDCDQPLSA